MVVNWTRSAARTFTTRVDAESEHASEADYKTEEREAEEHDVESRDAPTGPAAREELPCVVGALVDSPHDQPGDNDQSRNDEKNRQDIANALQCEERPRSHSNRNRFQPIIRPIAVIFSK